MNTGLWIPNEILLIGSLSANERLILAEIIYLDQGNGCFASNAHLESVLAIKQRTITDSLKKLAYDGYIYISNPNGRRRTIYINNERINDAIEEYRVCSELAKSAKSGETVRTNDILAKSARIEDENLAKNVENLAKNVENLAKSARIDNKTTGNSTAQEDILAKSARYPNKICEDNLAENVENLTKSATVEKIRETLYLEKELDKETLPPLSPPIRVAQQQMEEKAKAVPRETIIAMADYYNDNCDMLEQLEVLDKQLGLLIAMRVAEHGEDTVKNVIIKANNNLFLTGDAPKNGTRISATLPWLMDKQNFDDILKGAYETKQYQPKELTKSDWESANFGGIFRKQIDVRI